MLRLFLGDYGMPGTTAKSLTTLPLSLSSIIVGGPVQPTVRVLRQIDENYTLKPDPQDFSRRDQMRPVCPQGDFARCTNQPYEIFIVRNQKLQ